MFTILALLFAVAYYGSDIYCLWDNSFPVFCKCTLCFFLSLSETETFTLDLQNIPTSSPLSSTSFSDSSLDSEGTSSHSVSITPSQLSATASFDEGGNDSVCNRPFTSQILKTWPESFQVLWEKMPQESRSAVVQAKRPKPVERRQMIRILVDEMRRYKANPTRSQCPAVIRNIIKQYPKSFAEMTPNSSLLGGGCTPLLIQVKDQVENVTVLG